MMQSDSMDSKREEDGDDGRNEADEGVENDLINSESRTPLKTPSKDVEVKFIPGDSINGDAKIAIGHVKTGFAGMSKDELLKYVNDPFWVRTRMILFVLFWLIWVGMFVAAIAIIVMAPRCEAPKPRKWFEEGPIVDINLPKDAKSLSDVTDRLPYLADLKVKGIVLSSIFPSDKNGNAIDWKSVSSDLGTLEDLKNLLASAKEKAIRVLLTLVPNHLSIESKWFNSSVHQENIYDGFYIWAAASKFNADGSPLPPNNWLSVEGGSAWTWNPIRKQFYLHQFAQDQPDLNYHNSIAAEQIRDCMDLWLSLGVSGFNLERVQYLMEDIELRDEEIGNNPGSVFTQYEFWGHTRTLNVPGDAELVSNWRDFVREKTDNDGIIMITGKSPIASNMNQTSEPDLVRAGPFTKGLKPPISASDLLTRIEDITIKGGWPALEATEAGQYAVDLGENVVDLLNIVTMLLQGTPITRFGDEQGLTGTEVAQFLHTGTLTTESMKATNHLQLYRALANARESHSVLYGATNVTLMSESTLVLTRWRDGYPGFVAVWNGSPSNISLDLSGFEFFPAELTLLAAGDGSPANTRVSTKKVDLQHDVAALFTFVPAE